MARHGLWPTPAVFGNHNREYDTPNGKNRLGLSTAVKLWPTPTASDATGGPGNGGRDGGENLRTVVGGQLNMDWVDWLMGSPIGWGAAGRKVTESSRLAPNLLGSACSNFIEALRER
jgi:hypothetical protein